AEALVNSVHHQGIKKLGAGLEAIAWDKGDGMIEAFEVKGHPAGKVIGVQWHPEYNWNHTKELLSADRLLDQFLNHCKK
ncbi:MAG: C26 family cysteine hydrolase domain-containing family, partial [Flavobacteriales bacterium]|nr:C26 family cysteine hydrolase domain-containing family [Flavobacteriales bacterium]